MSEATLDRVLAWVESERAADADTYARLTVYASPRVVDARVPFEWVRLIFPRAPHVAD
jgi:hypothetical protein